MAKAGQKFSNHDFPKSVIDKMCKDNFFTRYNKEIREIDELIPFLYNILRPLRFKILRYFIHALSIVSTFLVVIQSYYFLKVFKFEIWIQYAPFYFVTCYISLSLPLAVKFYNTLFLKTQHYKKCILTDLALSGLTLKLNITRGGQVMSFVFVIHFGISMTLMIVNLIVWSQNETKYFIISLLLKDLVFAPIFTFCHWVLYLGALLTVYPMCLVPYYSSYSFSYIQVQIYLLSELVSDFSYIMNKERLVLPTNKLYQDAVRTKLRLIIKRHQEILLLNGKIISIIKTGHFMYLITAMLIFFYMIFSAFSPGFVWIQPASGFITVYAWTTYFCHQGETFEEASVHFLSALNNMKWYEWNEENKKTFLIIHKLAAIPLRIPVVSNVKLNYEFFQKVVKVMYSIGNILNSV